jgi:RNA polymerase sigma-70 factor, ECF subfamily
VNSISRPAPKVRPDATAEKQLILGLRNGDEASYEHVVRTYGGRLLAVARRVLRSEEDARDCVQEAFVQAFRGIQRFEERSSLGSWLHRIVVNAALMKIRSREQRREDSLEELMPQFDAEDLRAEPEALSTPLEALLESSQVRQLVHRSIDRLPDGYRYVLIARDIEGYNIEETAALLGLTAGTVKVRLHRARAALKALLAPIMKEQP